MRCNSRRFRIGRDADQRSRKARNETAVKFFANTQFREFRDSIGTIISKTYGLRCETVHFAWRNDLPGVRFRRAPKNETTRRLQLPALVDAHAD
jgi:hypothetical protein